MARKKVTRLDFLKITGATFGGSILACLGLGHAASRLIEIDAPEENKIET